MGIERKLVAEKQMLGIKFFKRVKPIIFYAYGILAKTLFKSGEKRDIFGHIFLVLDLRGRT